MRYALTPMAALLLGTSLASAQEFDLGEDVVFGNLDAVEAGAAGSTVTVLIKDELDAGGTQPLSTKLRTVAGVNVGTQGPAGTQTGVTIRGVNQNNIAVRFDGIDISDPSGPQVAYDFGGLNTAGLARVDVLRGSQSALYGSEAIGGAILIRSKRATAEGTEIEGGLEFGSYNTRAADFSLAARAERLDLSFGLSRFATDGFSAAEENGRPDPEADGHEQTRATFYAGYDVTDTGRVELSGFIAGSRTEYDFPPGDTDNETTKDEQALRLAFVQQFGGAQATVSMSRYDITRQLSSSWGSSTYEGRRDEADLRLAFSPIAQLDAIVGVSRTAEDYTDPTPLTNTNTVTSLYGEATYRATDAATLTLNLRRDDHSAYGVNWSGRVAGAFEAGQGVTLRASAGTGYRAPSSYELYGYYLDWFTGAPVVVGDPDMGIETSRSFDLGIEKDYGAGMVSATLFALEASDLIDYDFTTGTYVQRSGTASRHGLELASEWELATGTRLTGAYTWTETGGDASFDSSGWLAAVPEHQLALGVAHEFGRTTVSADAFHLRNREGLDDFTVVNLGLEHEVDDHMRAYVRVENVFDTEYQTVPGYGTSDRAAFFGIRVSN